MILFLSLFGSVEGNGLSPFARDFSSAMDLRDEIVFFHNFKTLSKRSRPRLRGSF
jgi:hypothetical protein